jgi:acetyltransferase-like isoleucine patch superfamily enzyme
MFRPSELSPRTRNLAAGLIQRAWGWISAVGAVAPMDAAGRRFASMGDGSCIAFPPGAVFGERYIAIGERTLIGPHVSLSAGMAEGQDLGPVPVVVIGARCNIGRGSHIVGHRSIEIGDDVTTGPYVYITDQNHVYADVDVPITRQWPSDDPVRIGAGSWIGAGAVILPGTDLGAHVVVAAGSVVRGQFPDNCVVAGAPAVIVRRHTAAGWVPPLRPVVIDPPADYVP